MEIYFSINQDLLKENKFAALVPNQSTQILDEITLESGIVLKQAPVAYKTWGKLNDKGDNVMVICHALSGSTDIEDW